MKPATAPLDPDQIVVKLFDQVIDEPTKLVLAKGLNFAPDPRTINYKGFIGGVEPAICSHTL